ncbi:MAG: DUF1934 domain-containing protein [Clostridiales bacterium]|jgi:uncharacterized beta-barrel protein YwiB (DUF1934 family)|nr:DUF1934 domain-containing protein [Clostridiales bacterium]
MKKDVIISLKGRQTDGEEHGEIELVTEGSYYKEDGNYYVTYDETEVTGMVGTTTTLKIEADKITMLRCGQNNSQMIFEKGRRHLCCYETPFGAFTIGVRSNNVSIDVSENGGEISAEYRVEIDNNASGSNDFHLRIREC